MMSDTTSARSEPPRHQPVLSFWISDTWKPVTVPMQSSFRQQKMLMPWNKLESRPSFSSLSRIAEKWSDSRPW